MLLRWAGDDPSREGLIDTPARVVKAFEEFFSGYREDATGVLSRVFEEVQGYDDIILVRDIAFSSHCEHHMVPFFGVAHIAYYPSEDGVVGLSSFANLQGHKFDEALPRWNRCKPRSTRVHAAGRADCRRNAGRTADEPAALGEPTACANRFALGTEPFRAGAADLPGDRRTGGGGLLYRARTPRNGPVGALESAPAWRKRRQTRQAGPGIDQAAGGFDPAELRKAAIIVDGYVAEAGLDRNATQWETVTAEAGTAAGRFIARVSAELESLVARLAERHAGWFTRCRYELLLAAMLGLLLYRLGKNFFYDSWLAPHPAPVYGLEFYVSAAFWLALWCFVLLWAFCRRLRRGLRASSIGSPPAGKTPRLPRAFLPASKLIVAAWSDSAGISTLFAVKWMSCGGRWPRVKRGQWAVAGG